MDATGSSSKHFLAGKHIIIVGGGIAGSAFAVAVHQLWNPALDPPSITIYERDAEDVAMQREGYSLSLAGHSSHGGLVTLARLGLLDKVLEHAISGLDGSGSFKIWNSQWRAYISFRQKPISGIPASSIRIARKDLRRTIHDAVGERTIKWEAQCTGAQRLDDGRIAVQVVDEDGTREEECDLLIAADGASSKLRSFLRPDDKLEYTGAVLRGGLSRFEEALPEPLTRDWGFMLSGNGISCFFSPVDKHSVVWAVGHLEDEMPPLDRQTKAHTDAVVDRACVLGSRFAEPFPTIVRRTDLSTVMCLNARDKLPFRHDTLLSASDGIPIVFIGDSNHALSPFAGYGANLALADGWDLAEQLCRGKTLQEAVAAYDQVSVPRARNIVKGSRARVRTGHSTGLRYWVFLGMLMVARLVRVLLGRERR